MQTRHSDRAKPAKKYNPYGDDFVEDKLGMKKTLHDLLDLEEITLSQIVDVDNDQDKKMIRRSVLARSGI